MAGDTSAVGATENHSPRANTRQHRGGSISQLRIGTHLSEWLLRSNSTMVKTCWRGLGDHQVNPV